MKTLESRLASLERGLRRWKLISCCLAIATVGAYVMAAAPETVPDVVRCHKLEVVNPEGKVVADVDGSSKDGWIRCYNREGVQKINMGAWYKEGLLEVKTGNERGDACLMFMASDLGGDSLHLSSGTGHWLHFDVRRDGPPTTEQK